MDHANQPEPLQGVQEVVELLRSEVAARRSKRRWMLIGAYGLLVVTILASFFGPKPISDYSIWVAIFVGGGLLGSGTLLKNAVRSARNVSDKRLVGPLLEATAIGEPEVEEEAWSALKPLLFELNSEDVLTARQQEILCGILGSSKDAELVVGAIHAVRALKIYAAVAPLERLASGPARLEADASKHAQNLALMALGELRIGRAGELIRERSPLETPDAQAQRLRIGGDIVP